MEGEIMSGQFARDQISRQIHMTGGYGCGGVIGKYRQTHLYAQFKNKRPNYVKCGIDNKTEWDKCKVCGEKDEAVWHIVSECPKLAHHDYKDSMAIVEKMMHLGGLWKSRPIKSKDIVHLNPKQSF